MALNSSGPISLIGNIVGQSIELELGGTGTTQLSLFDPTVRTLAGISSGPIGLFNLYGKSSWPFTGTNQGGVLVGGTLTAASYQGNSVTLSADGNTMAMYNAGYNTVSGSTQGDVWVFTRSGTTWSQQTKITFGNRVGNGSSSNPIPFQAIKLSADGTTMAIADGADGASNQGAIWVYVYSGGVWSQQTKIVGANSLGLGGVALSADGNTIAAAGGFGYVPIYVRTGSTWNIQTGISGGGAISGSPSLSSNGNILVLGATGYSTYGGAQIYVKSSSTWVFQAAIQGTGGVGTQSQGYSCAISSDGTTIAIGGPSDNTNNGAVWIFTGSGSTWTQQGSKLVGTGGVKGSYGQGYTIDISSTGDTLVVGAPYNNSQMGEGWVFHRTSGAWAQAGSKLSPPTGYGGTFINFGNGVAISGTSGTTAAFGIPYNKPAGSVYITGGTAVFV